MLNLNLEQISAMTFLIVFGAGVLTSLTPCSYPLIPIVIGYLGSLNVSFRRRIFATVLYALGMSLVYTLLGVLAAITGQMFGEMTSSPWLYIGFGILILYLGGSMMEWYEIKIPLIKTSRPQSAFLLGLTSGLVASPCTAPVLASILLLVAQKKQVLLGASLLFCFSLGLNLLFIILGVFSGFINKLPRSGVWMVKIKKLLAFLMLGAGLYFVFKAGTLA